MVDLALGHLKALEWTARKPGLLCCNLGTGKGFSVLEMVETFARVNECKVPYQVAGRRAGDIATCFADPSLAASIIGWRAERGLEEMCRDGWNWQRKNPQGYQGEM